jgi:hypothetical protein
MSDKVLAEFAKWVIENSVFEGIDLTGWEIEDKAVELGLLIEEKYDPELHGPNNCDSEPGYPWLVFSPILSPKGRNRNSPKV